MKIHLGCGNNYIEGFVNVDRSPHCKTDVQHDAETFPYPFEDNVADYILIEHLVEHISKDNFIPFVRELHRICKPGGFVEILAPHYTCINAYTDFTHVRYMTEESFGYFCKDHRFRHFGVLYGAEFEFSRAEVTIEHPHPYVEVRYKLYK
jgi:predicted SAM-dependent methyltransferase